MDIVEYANYIEEGLTNEEIAEKYGYTNEEMKEVLEKIGIIFDGAEADRYKENIYCRWTKEDEEYLIKNHKRMNNEELGVSLGRSYSSIDQRKRDLGLSTTQQNHRRWTKEEDDYLEKNYKSMSIKELSIALGRTYPAVAQRMPILGLKEKSREAKEYVAYKGNAKIGVGTLSELSKKTGYSRSTLKHRSYSSGRQQAGEQGLKLFELEVE